MERTFRRYGISDVVEQVPRWKEGEDSIRERRGRGGEVVVEEGPFGWVPNHNSAKGSSGEPEGSKVELEAL